MKTLFAVAAAVLSASPLFAQGWIEPAPNVRCECAVQRVRSAVSVRVTGRVARIEVEEWFLNQGGALGQSDYLYPLPGEAVFSNFSLFQGDQELTGETMDAARARAIYEEIVRRKRDPALIELAGHGLIRARVFPINPGETRKITLRYTQVLGRAGDALQLRYAAGRAGTQGLRPGSAVTEPAPISLSVTVDSADQYREPFSPTHSVRTDRTGDRMTVRADNIGGDLSLFLPLARGLVGLTVATHRPSSEDGFFMLTLSPGTGRGDAPAQPRDVTAVVDVSGSMSGTKMSQARAALGQLLGSLNRGDRFRLISFSSGVSNYRGTWTQATPDEITAARQWVERLAAEGGTNIEGALREAFQQPTPNDRLPIVLFLTDGLPSVGEQNAERIAAQAEQAHGRARVFAVGVGFDVNTQLLDRLSAAGRGATQYVQAESEVETALGQLITKISLPVLTDLEIAGAPATLREVYPGKLPDLFAGEELVVFGRYTSGGQPSGPVVITGRRNGVTERFSVNADFPASSTANDFMPRLWASRKIGVLTRSIRLEGSSPELEREIRETAMRYGILSEYTSYLVQEPVMTASSRPASLPPEAERNRLARQSSGQGAVAAAAEQQQLRDMKNESDLLSAMSKAGADEARKDARGERRVGAKLFRQKAKGWVDATVAESLRLVTIEPYSDAWFRVLEVLPEIKPYVSAMETVVVGGVRVRIGMGVGGVTTLTPSEIAALVREFRGR